MTQQTDIRSTFIPSDMRCAGAEPLCPACGAPCSHTPDEMQGFAMDALQQASDGLAHDEEACRRANEADAAQRTIALLTKQLAELRSTPPMAFAKLANDGTFAAWIHELIHGGSMNHKGRKAIARSIRDLVKACAEEQRSASVTALYQAVMTQNWVPMSTLPPPYEEVRILTDGITRIARLAHDKTHFQLATFLANTKGQYLVSVEKVQGWQPLFAAPGTGAPVAPATPA